VLISNQHLKKEKYGKNGLPFLRITAEKPYPKGKA